MKRLIFMRLLVVWLVCLPFSVWAETMVLVPGFQAQGMDWRFLKVTPALQANGWVDGGNFMMTRDGILNTVRLPKRPEHVFYTINLPTTANVGNQAGVLNQYLHAIYQHRQEPLTLVGHSAGGIVARHWLVTANSVPVKTLVTIASPHLGTPMAELSRLFSNMEIINLMETFGFGRIKDAKGLFSDLREEKPNTYLYWLNHQPHPAIRYVAIVRDSETPESVDLIVPKHSQDMNNIYVLHGRAERWNSDDGHFLTARDGAMLVQIMRP